MILRRGAFTFPELLVLVCIAALLLSIVLPAIQRRREALERARKQATLRFERRSAFSGAFCSLDIFVNGLKVGSIGNGSEAEFRFTPRKDGRNALRVELITLIGPNQLGPTIQFAALPGAVVEARSDMNSWQVKAFPDIILTVETENPGKVPAVLAATEQNQRNWSEVDSWISVDERNFFVAVCGVMVAILAWRRPVPSDPELGNVREIAQVRTSRDDESAR